MSSEPKEVEQEEENEYEPWQYEHSVEVAQDYIEEILLPQLLGFESNDDEDYVNGTATYGLFIELIQQLKIHGYTENDLVETVRDYINTSIGQVLH